MSPPSKEPMWDLLKEVRDAVAEQGKDLALTKAAAERTEKAVDDLKADMVTVQGQTRAALARNAELARAIDADTDAPGWWYRSGPLAWFRRWPKAVMVAGGMVLAAAAWGLPVAARLGLIYLGVPASAIPQSSSAGGP